MNPVISVKNFGLDLGMHVADFGAGAGHFTVAMADIVGGSGKIHAIDIMDSALEVIDSEKRIHSLLQIEIIKSDLEKQRGSTLEDNSQNFVLCANILHQSKNPALILKEAYRILKSGYKLVVIDWFEKGILGPLNRISREEVEKLAQNVGFKKENEIDAGGLHYGIVFKKN